MAFSNVILVPKLSWNTVLQISPNIPGIVIWHWGNVNSPKTEMKQTVLIYALLFYSQHNFDFNVPSSPHQYLFTTGMWKQKVNISFSFLWLRCSPRVSGTMQMRCDWGMLLGCFMGHQGTGRLPMSMSVNGKLAALGSDVWFNIAKDIYSKTTAHEDTVQNCRLCLKDQKGLFIWDIKINCPSALFCWVFLAGQWPVALTMIYSLCPHNPCPLL